MRRRFEVEVTTTVIVEIDDEATSDYYLGETILTAHRNRERFVEGATADDAVGSLAIALGIHNRRLPHVDGWADFAADAATAAVTDERVESVYEQTPQTIGGATHG